MSTFTQLALCRTSALLGFRSLVLSLALAASVISVSQAYAATFSVSYSGRLTQATGAPVDGPVDISVKFWNASVSGNSLTAPIDFTAVDLNSGVFSLALELSADQVQQIYGDLSSPVYIEITAAGKTYPRQQYSFVPYALRIPVDNKTLAFDSNGNLGLAVNGGAPANNQFLTKDTSGRLTWGSPAVTSLQGQNIASTQPSSGQVLQFIGGQWVPQNITTSGSASLPNVGTAGTYVKVVTDAQGRVTQGLSLAAADVTGALGFTPLSSVNFNAGSGLNGGTITNGGTISLANTSVSPGTYTRANITVDATGRITAAQSAAPLLDADIASGAAIAQSKIQGLVTDLAGKEPALPLGGTANQFLSGTKAWQILTTAVVAESGTNLYYTDARARGVISANAPLSYSISSGQISLAQASGTASGYLRASDWTTFNGKQNTLGFTPLNKAGDSMSGALDMNGQEIINAGNVTISTAKTLGLGIFDNTSEATMVALLDSTGATSPDKGKTWFNSSTSQIKYWTGSTAQSLGVSGAGLTNLNGLMGNTQTFATGTSGNSPAFSSMGTVHTLNIPLAASSGVSAGLISNSDFANFSGKLGGVAAGTGVSVSTTSGTATVSLSSVGTAGTYTKVQTNAQGQVLSGGTLSAGDIPGLDANKITSGQLSVANGGTGVNSTATFPTSGVVVTRDATETLTNKTLTVAMINGASSIGGSTTINTSGTVNSGAQTVSGNVTILGNSTTANKLVLNDKGSTNSVALKAPDTLASSLTWELPSTNGSSGQVLATNGSGTLSWVSAAVGSVTNVTGTSPISVATGTSTPVISISQANGTTNGYLSSADWTTFNSKQAAGSYITALTGDVTATGPGSAAATLAAVAIAGTSTKVTYDVKGRVTLGTSLAAADIPPLSAAIITSGTLAAANGGTGVNSTATFPTSGVVVTEAATETLTNKTLTAATINGASSIGGSTTISTTGTAATGALTAVSVSSQGNVTILGNGTTANKLVLNDKGSTNSVALKAPDTLPSSLTWELPSTNGSSGQVLSNNGSGTLSWVSAAVGSVTNVTGTDPISVATGTSTPVVSMSQANGTTNGYLSSADWTTFNNKQSAGNYITALTGDVTASGAGSAAASLSTTGVTAGTYTKVTVDAKGRATAGTSLVAADIPAHSAALISSGTLAVANGGTGVSSTTANSVFAGPTSGSGAPSFRALVAGDLPAMGGANGTAAGTAGAVPGPAATDNVKFLRGDGTWATPAASAAGATNQIQYNSAGALTGNANFVYSGGNVGVGTTNPVAALDINGAMRLKRNSQVPFTCNSAADGALAMNGNYQLCSCNGASGTWVRGSDGSTACVFNGATFNYTGAVQTFLVPAGVTQITVKAWGAGGGGYMTSGIGDTTAAGAAGSGGGYATANITVTPGETLTVIVGGGGGAGIYGLIGGLGGYGGGGSGGAYQVTWIASSGGGGGRSAIQRAANDLITAGGGGGGGGSYANDSMPGVSGVGGGTTGGSGGNAGTGGGGGGGGGSQSAGGSAGTSVSVVGTGGSKYAGGTAASSARPGGGGGGGYYGGGSGGGGGDGTNWASGGGGGGGSSFTTGGSTLSGSGSNAANTGDADYVTGVGVGGARGVAGGNGLIKISW